MENKENKIWVVEMVSNALEQKCPEGFEVNKKALPKIAKRLIITEGVCPCNHEEWDNTTPKEDKLCPCKTFRETNDCHCGLFKKVN